MESLGVTYIRLPVSDHQRPSDEIVDQFLAFVLGMPKEYWFHFHCKAGRGRTTTFMVLYDIIKNGREVSLEEILARQEKMGGCDLTDTEKERGANERIFFARERLKMVEDFYLYCLDVPDFSISWSEWVQNRLAFES